MKKTVDAKRFILAYSKFFNKYKFLILIFLVSCHIRIFCKILRSAFFMWLYNFQSPFLDTPMSNTYAYLQSIFSSDLLQVACLLIFQLFKSLKLASKYLIILLLYRKNMLVVYLTIFYL